MWLLGAFTDLKCSQRLSNGINKVGFVAVFLRIWIVCVGTEVINVTLHHQCQGLKDFLKKSQNHSSSFELTANYKQNKTKKSPTS